jgi:hypothetical protein
MLDHPAKLLATGTEGKAGVPQHASHRSLISWRILESSLKELGFT